MYRQKFTRIPKYCTIIYLYKNVSTYEYFADTYNQDQEVLIRNVFN